MFNTEFLWNIGLCSIFKKYLKKKKKKEKRHFSHLYLRVIFWQASKLQYRFFRVWLSLIFFFFYITTYYNVEIFWKNNKTNLKNKKKANFIIINDAQVPISIDENCHKKSSLKIVNFCKLRLKTKSFTTCINKEEKY